MHLGLLVLLSTVVLKLPSARAATCRSLASVFLPDTTITLAEPVPAESFKLPPEFFPARAQAGEAKRQFEQSFNRGLPAFCRVAAIISPTADSEIKIEVWMPTSGWNGKFLAVGNGGWAGSISYGELADSVKRGYATASTDTGHTDKGGDAGFAFGHPEKLTDLGYRSVHLMTVQAKVIIAAFYGNEPRRSYWNGCSTGGKQGLTEAQRYPDDYDGIAEGDAASFWTHLMFGTIWPAEVDLKNSASHIPPSKYALIHKAALDACDKLDGLQDGIIDDPRRCHFDPKVLECEDSDSPSCLTAPQVEAAQKIYAGPVNPRTGKQVFPGLMPGSELGWGAEAGGPQPMAIPESYFKYVLFKNPNWQWQTLNFDKDVALADRLDGSILNAIDPNLKAFKAHGGKLLMYHGWSDNLITPLESINY